MTKAVANELQNLREVGDIIRELNDCGFEDAIYLIDRLTKERDAAESLIGRRVELPEIAAAVEKGDR